MSSESELKNTSLGIAITDPISISSIFGNPTMDEINKLLFNDVQIPAAAASADSKTDNNSPDEKKDEKKDEQNVNSQDDNKNTDDKTGCKFDYLLPK